ncbi:MAG TPA: hypothetical protein PLG43_02810 [Spirochaetia bacterium]|nr:hypothetical protein [Spirochaetia bacterium]
MEKEQPTIETTEDRIDVDVSRTRIFEILNSPITKPSEAVAFLSDTTAALSFMSSRPPYHKDGEHVLAFYPETLRKPITSEYAAPRHDDTFEGFLESIEYKMKTMNGEELKTLMEKAKRTRLHSLLALNEYLSSIVALCKKSETLTRKYRIELSAEDDTLISGLPWIVEEHILYNEQTIKKLEEFDLEKYLENLHIETLEERFDRILTEEGILEKGNSRVFARDWNIGKIALLAQYATKNYNFKPGGTYTFFAEKYKLYNGNHISEDSLRKGAAKLNATYKHDGKEVTGPTFRDYVFSILKKIFEE